MELNSNSIENWCIELDKEPRDAGMSKDQLEIFASLFMSKEKFDRDPDLRGELEKTDFCSSIMSKRIKAIHTYDVSNSALVFMSMLSESPGECFMLINYLQYKSKELNKTKFELIDLVDLFERGGWRSEVKNKYWSLQKLTPDQIGEGRSDNLLDYPKYGKSLGIKQLGDIN